jgi:hypothetical protein
MASVPHDKRASIGQAEMLLQAAIDLKMSPEVLDELSNKLYSLTQVPNRRWSFIMISQQQFRDVSLAISKMPHGGKTLLLWTIIVTYIRQDTGELLVDRDELAKTTNTLPDNVSRSLTELVKIGALIRIKRGRRTVYFMNPHVCWNGTEGARQAAAQNVQPVAPIRLATVDGQEISSG